MNKLKKMLAVLVCMAITLTFVPTMTVSAAMTADGLEYDVYDDHVEIIDYAGSATNLTIPAEIEGLPVTIIVNHAFNSCDSLTSVIIGNGVTSIGNRAFSYCYSLTSVTIPDSVTNIGEGAFYDCESLTSVTIGNGVASIGEYAFADCYRLASVTIPGSVTNIGEEAFRECYSLTDIIVEDNNLYYCDVDGVLFDKDAKTLIQYPIGNPRETYKIPGSVTSIGEYAFEICRSLTSVTIGNGVTSIGDYAFSCCDSLTSVTIGNGVASIGKDAFWGCESLTSVTIPGSVTSIGKYAFENCFRLTSVTIGDGVASIGACAFVFCDSLTDVYYTGSEIQWKNISIEDSNDELLNANIHYNSNGLLDSVTNTGNVSSKHYGATKYERTAAGRIYDAAVEYNKALEEYLAAVKSEAKDTSKGSLTLEEKGKLLMDADKKSKYNYITIAGASDDVMLSAYMALAECLDVMLNNKIAINKIDLDDPNYMIDAKLTQSILSNLGNYKKVGSYKGCTVSMNVVFFGPAGAGSISVQKGGRPYAGIFASHPDEVTAALNDLLGSIKEIADDTTKQAAASLLSELSGITGFDLWFKNDMENRLQDAVKVLRKHGFGNVMKLFNKCSDGYEIVKKIIAFKDVDNIQSALSNAEDIYNKLSKLDYSDSAVDKFIIKKAMDKIKSSQKKLCDELYSYIYNTTGKEPEKPSFFDKVGSWFSSLFQCPVDFTVYNEDGAVIGYVNDGEVYYNDDIYIETSGDTKKLYVPSNMKVRIDMIGTDDGEFNYVLEEVVDGEPIGRRNYYNIPLTDGAEFEQTIDLEQVSITSDIVINSETDCISADEYLSADDMTAFVTINANSDEKGVVIGAGRYAKGDLVELSALTSDEKYAFSGWYIGDELVSSDGVYRFTALEDVTVTAKFERKYNIDDCFDIDMSECYEDYSAYVYKNTDDSRGIFVAPFTDYINEEMIVYFTSYNADGTVLCDNEKHIAKLGENNCYDFEDIDFKNACHFVIKDESGTVIASSNYNITNYVISTVGKYNDNTIATATVENGIIAIELYFTDDVSDIGGINGYIAKYAENGSLESSKTLSKTETESGLLFTGTIGAGYKVMLWDNNNTPVTEGFIPTE